MIVDRTFTVNLDENDTAFIYSTDIAAAVLEVLRRQYVGTCHMGCYITEVVAVTRSGPTLCDSTRNSGAVGKDVIMHVRAAVYNLGECIPAARIVRVLDDGTIFLKSDHISIAVFADSRLDTWRTGATVPLRVVEAAYTPRRREVGMSAIPFAPPPSKRIEWAVDAGTCADVVALAAQLQLACDAWHARPAAVRTRWERTLNPSAVRMGAGWSQVALADIRGTGLISTSEWEPIACSTVWWRADSAARAQPNHTALRGALMLQLQTTLAAAAIADTYDTDTAAVWLSIWTGKKTGGEADQ